MMTSTAVILKQKIKTKSSALTKVIREASVIADCRGSRTYLAELVRELGVIIRSLRETNLEYKIVVRDDNRLAQEADRHMETVEAQYEEIFQRIEVYVTSRQDDAQSEISEDPSPYQRVRLHRKRQMETEHLRRQHERERREMAMRQLNELEAAKDAEELAKLEAELDVGSVSSSSQERNPNEERRISTRTTEPPVSVSSTAAGSSALAPQQQPTVANCESTAPPAQPSPARLLDSLPRLELPKFDGSSAEWPRWISLFRLIIHNQPALSADEKMLYLQSSLTGRPALLIGGMLCDGRLYERALKELETRFGRPDDIVHVNMQRIFDCPAPKYLDPGTLGMFHAVVHCTVCVLKQMNYLADLESVENLSRVVRMLPQEYIRRWLEHAIDMEPQRATLFEFDDWLAKEVRIAQRVDSIAPFQNSDNEDSEPQNALTGGNGDGSCCVCCQEDHFLEDCRSFQERSVDRRAQLVLESGICFICLRQGHRSRRCAFARECGIDGCRMRHHEMLHGSRRVTR